MADRLEDELRSQKTYVNLLAGLLTNHLPVKSFLLRTVNISKNDAKISDFLYQCYFYLKI